MSIGVPTFGCAPEAGSNLVIASIYLQGIDGAEIIDTVHAAARRWSPSTHRSNPEPRSRSSSIAVVIVAAVASAAISGGLAMCDQRLAR